MPSQSRARQSPMPSRPMHGPRVSHDGVGGSSAIAGWLGLDVGVREQSPPFGGAVDLEACALSCAESPSLRRNGYGLLLLVVVVAAEISPYYASQSSELPRPRTTAATSTINSNVCVTVLLSDMRMRVPSISWRDEPCLVLFSFV